MSGQAPERRALLGLGSNLGDRLAWLRAAVDALRAEPAVDVLAISPVYESPPMGPVAQGPYLNAAVLVATPLAPRDLLVRCLAIEQAHGRVREVRWGPRTIDLDVLWIEDVTVSEPGLEVPHPGLAQRAFVLRPVADIMPMLALRDGRTAAQAAGELAHDGCVRLPGSAL